MLPFLTQPQAAVSPRAEGVNNSLFQTKVMSFATLALGRRGKEKTRKRQKLDADFPFEQYDGAFNYEFDYVLVFKESIDNENEYQKVNFTLFYEH